jgi:DNA-binding response OmpR family regulator
MITILTIGPEDISTLLEGNADLSRRLHDLRLKTPVILLGPRTDDAEKIRLELGADYVAKPCSSPELAARIRAILRSTALSAEQTVCFGDVEVNFERRCITRRGEEVKMTRAEYNLLAFFLRNADRPLTRDAILSRVWGYDIHPNTRTPNTRTVDAHMVKLRQKLEPDPSAPRHFLTIHGVGYRFMMNPA